MGRSDCPGLGGIQQLRQPGRVDDREGVGRQREESLNSRPQLFASSKHVELRISMNYVSLDLVPGKKSGLQGNVVENHMIQSEKNFLSIVFYTCYVYIYLFIEDYF